MNISTYEARIAALEAQLGPGPGPSAETGIVSVKVTPDISLKDGSSLNARLAELMPMASGEETINSEFLKDLAQSYQVTITPGANWYAAKQGDEYGGRGEQVINTVYTSNGAFLYNAAVVEDTADESAPYAVIRIRITATE